MGQKRKITTLYDPLCSLWFNRPYHDRIHQKSEKVRRIHELPASPKYPTPVLYCGSVMLMLLLELSFIENVHQLGFSFFERCRLSF
jgi:hypothetical protein